MLLLTSSFSIAQSLIFNDNDLEYKGIIEAVEYDSVKLKELSIKWINKYFKDSELKVNEKNKIVKKGSYTLSIRYLYTKIPEEIFYDLTLEFKNGKFRYVINNFTLVSQGIQKFTFFDRYKSAGPVNKKIYYKKTKENIQKLMAEIKNITTENSSKNDEW